MLHRSQGMRVSNMKQLQFDPLSTNVDETESCAER